MSNTTNVTTPNVGLTILSLSKTSISANFETVLQVLVGMILVHPKIGILNREIVGHFSKIMFYIFLPLFSIEKYATNIDWATIQSIWIVPVFSIVFQIFVLIFAEVIYSRPFWCLKEGMKCGNLGRTVLIFTIAFQNGGLIPLNLLESFSRSGIFVDPKVESTYVTLVTMYILPLNIFIYGYGLGYYEKSREFETPHERELRKEKEKKEKLTTKRDFKTFLKLFVINTIKLIKQVITIPMIGMMIGTIIGLTPFFKKHLITEPPLVLDSFLMIISKYSNSLLAFAMVITGANLGETLFKRDSNERMKNMTFSSKFGKLWHYIRYEIIVYNTFMELLVNVLTKLVVLPLITLGAVVGLAYAIKDTDLIKREIRPMMYMMFVIEAGVPMAVMMSTIASMYKKGIEQVSEIMIFQYLFSPITLVVFCVISLFVFCGIESDQCTI